MAIGPFWCFGLTQWELGCRWVPCGHKRRVRIHDPFVRLNGVEAAQESVLGIISTLGPWGLPRSPPGLQSSTLSPTSCPFPFLSHSYFCSPLELLLSYWFFPLESLVREGLLHLLAC